jgi:hypothetical protein
MYNLLDRAPLIYGHGGSQTWIYGVIDPHGFTLSSMVGCPVAPKPFLGSESHAEP